MLTEQTEYSLKLADLVFRIRAQYPPRKRFRDYLTEETPDFTVSITEADIAWERKRSERYRDEDLQDYHFEDPYLETLALYRKIAELLPTRGTFLFHGSVIEVDGNGYLFTAKSGTGKSTHTRLWREQFTDRARMVNDDKPLLKVTDQAVIAYGTPWNGKHHLGDAICAPLKGICILERALENTIEKLPFREAYPMLLQQSYRPSDPAALMATLALLEKLPDRVAFYRLGCNMDPQAALVAYNGMNERKENE